jgi:HSP20 family protein
MSKELSRLINALFLPAADRFQDACWQPPVDVYQTRTGWLVKCELAGVRPEDVSVHIDSPRLTVRGTRRDSFTEEDCHCYRMEISYSHFERTIELPANLEQAGIDTEYEYGLLLIRIQTEATS